MLTHTSQMYECEGTTSLMATKNLHYV